MAGVIRNYVMQIDWVEIIQSGNRNRMFGLADLNLIRVAVESYWIPRLPKQM